MQHDIANHDEFRKVLLNTEAFKQQLQQWTDHDSLTALDVYINLAFSELSNMDMAYNAVNLGSAVSVFQDRLDSLKEEIAKGESPITYLVCELEELIDTFQEDLDLAAKY